MLWLSFGFLLEMQRSWKLSDKGTLQLFSRSQREYAINEEGFSAEKHEEDGSHESERQFKVCASVLLSSNLRRVD